jgi:hypothetical protein
MRNAISCFDAIRRPLDSTSFAQMKSQTKRLIAGLAVTAAAVALIGCALAWNEYFRTPPDESNPLAPALIALDSPQGRKLLTESDATADYHELRTHFVPQSRKAYCSVASAITTLNAARLTPAPIDERSLFAHPSVDIHPLKVSFIGMSLRELGAMLRAHGADAEVVQASDTTLDAFRQTVRANLRHEGDFLLINYEREHLGQVQSGHISPLAAYHAPTDRVLILDVAAYRYPPVWAPLEDVWKAMRAPLNDETTITRGFIVVRGKPM